MNGGPDSADAAQDTASNLHFRRPRQAKVNSYFRFLFAWNQGLTGAEKVMPRRCRPLRGLGRFSRALRALDTFGSAHARGVGFAQPRRDAIGDRLELVKVLAVAMHSCGA